MVTAMPANELSATALPSLDEIWAWLREVTDPEIPAVSIVDFGIVRDVAWIGENADTCLVTITPTYAGCPAIEVIYSSIREELQSRGIVNVKLQVRLSPPWTTDWLSPDAIKNLRDFGIAPPLSRTVSQSNSVLPVLNSYALQPYPACPRCGSARTALISQFGSTLCKALYRCEDCMEPFDYFKCH